MNLAEHLLELLALNDHAHAPLEERTNRALWALGIEDEDLEQEIEDELRDLRERRRGAAREHIALGTPGPPPSPVRVLPDPETRRVTATARIAQGVALEMGSRRT